MLPFPERPAVNSLADYIAPELHGESQFRIGQERLWKNSIITVAIVSGALISVAVTLFASVDSVVAQGTIAVPLHPAHSRDSRQVSFLHQISKGAWCSEVVAY